MKDHEFANLFAASSAYLGLFVAAFFMMTGIAVAGVTTSTFLTQTSSPQPAAVVLAQATPDDFGNGTINNGYYCPQLSQTLSRGATDSNTNPQGQVSELQKFLADYYNVNPNDLVSGYFGHLTQSYVIQFQQTYGLPAYGIVGGLTRPVIARVCAGTEAPLTTSTTAPTVPTTSTAPTQTTTQTPTTAPTTTRTNLKNTVVD